MFITFTFDHIANWKIRIIIRLQIITLYTSKKNIICKKCKIEAQPWWWLILPATPHVEPLNWSVFNLWRSHTYSYMLYIAICVLLFNLWRSQLWRSLDLAHGAKWSRGTAAPTTHQLCHTTSALKLLLLQRWSWERKSLNSALTPGNMPLSCSDKNSSCFVLLRISLEIIFLQDPGAWWMGQIVSYLLRPRQDLKVYSLVPSLFLSFF